MSDDDVRRAVFAEVEGVGGVELIMRAGGLVELLNREIVGVLAGMRASAAREALKTMTVLEVSVATGLTPARIRRLDQNAAG